LIELACEQAEAAGIVQLNEDEAGPYQAIPQPGASWQLEGHPLLQPHEYERGGTAKLLTLFRPATDQLRAKGLPQWPKPQLLPCIKESTFGYRGFTRLGREAGARRRARETSHRLSSKIQV